MNFFKGRLARGGSQLVFVSGDTENPGVRLRLNDTLSRIGAKYIDREVILGIRPEDIEDVLTLTNPDPEATFTAQVEISEPMGAETYLYLNAGEHSFIARVRSMDKYAAHQEVKVCLDMERAHLFDPESEYALK